MIHVINFQAQFAEMVASGAKPHTIRLPRKREIHPGDTLRLYTGLRTKRVRLLLEKECLRVTALHFDIIGGLIYLDGRHEPLHYMTMYLLSRNDGFDGVFSLRKWFKERYLVQKGMPYFDGHLIAWGGPDYLALAEG